MKNSLVILISSLNLMACSSMPYSSNKNTAQNNWINSAPNVKPTKEVSIDGSYTGEIVGDYQNSKFSQLKIGMSKNQVEDLVGASTDERSYQTAKAWIPVAGAFSKDQFRIETYYKDAGRLVYAYNGTKLYRIEVDQNEDGVQ
ncbi:MULTISPECIES: hypothetical protein [unclassified Acinetobacter]|uniref:hypothetical protein n=1 Tax=unclassified Acinetobacter TaxID=196816 RepID=UPI001202D5F4|nr:MULTISPECIES: hypothetical protein [unclassified Acinetobacter]RZJ21943.1 MAG: hypothetical protein EON51_09430 [Acinetobacter sp.]